MNRRNFLLAASIVSGTRAFSMSKGGSDHELTTSRNWRTFEVTTRVEVLKPSGTTRIWVPSALISSTPFQKTISNAVDCEGGSAKTFQDKKEALGIIAAEFPAGVKPILTVTSCVRTRDWSVKLDATGNRPDILAKVNASEANDYLRSTKLLPTDGIVKDRATEITKSAGTDLGKARAIYDWIVENTRRNPKTRGCGVGNIRYMLESGDLSGKCADISALYVGLARAAGLPARDVYGIRVAKSEMGFKSLGPSSSNITKAQHCRAEVYLSDYGWVPVDPADVRKVMLEETPGNRSPDDELVKRARARLFGSWEMNWIAYNYAQDVALAGSSGPLIRFLMYPQAETSEGRLDSLDPDSFQYEITSKEIAPLNG